MSISLPHAFFHQRPQIPAQLVPSFLDLVFTQHSHVSCGRAAAALLHGAAGQCPTTPSRRGEPPSRRAAVYFVAVRKTFIQNIFTSARLEAHNSRSSFGVSKLPYFISQFDNPASSCI